MTTTISVHGGSAFDLDRVADSSVDLVVTSPPYPMIEMWDGVFSEQEGRIAAYLSAGRGHDAFESMHSLLEKAWIEIKRVLKPGGIACVNIGDAVRTIDGDFRLYSNHSRILGAFLGLGFDALPDILWRKQTNAPNKFMGSGMLPVGAYVTYEHEYILILRKGRRRVFASARDKETRSQSAFFWEERNVWFSDLWSDIKGAAQSVVEKTLRARSAAFPFELAHRLICMFSIKGDVVLDPFAGTGTTLFAALTSARNAVGIERDTTFIPYVCRSVRDMPPYANQYNQRRLARHVEFVREQAAECKPLKYANSFHGFPVKTSQEQRLLITDVSSIDETTEGLFTVSYRDEPLGTAQAGMGGG
jgi:modification methylase